MRIGDIARGTSAGQQEDIGLLARRRPRLRPDSRASDPRHDEIAHQLRRHNGSGGAQLIAISNVASSGAAKERA